MALKTELKQFLYGLFGVHASDTVDVRDQVNRLYRKPIVVIGPDDGAAGTAVGDTYIFHAEENCKVVKVGILYSGASDIAADASNYATFNLKKADGAGGTSAVVATANTSATALEIGELFALTVSTDTVTAGEVLAFAVAKTGTGADLGTYAVYVELEEE